MIKNNLSKTFRYTNDNNIGLTFSYTSGYIINKPEGIDSLTTELTQAQGTNQIGSIVNSVNVQPRPITISGKILGGVDKKNNLLSAIRPDIGGKLYAYDPEKDEEYYLRVYPTISPIISADNNGAYFQLSLLAPYPYWIKVGTTTSSNDRITNNGQVPVPFKLTITSSGGDSSDIVIRNQATFKHTFLRIDKTIASNETLIVNITHDRVEAISSTLGDVSGAIKLDSDFFRLEIGPNTIQAISNGTGTLSLTFEYAEELVGIAV